MGQDFVTLKGMMLGLKEIMSSGLLALSAFAFAGCSHFSSQDSDYQKRLNLAAQKLNQKELEIDGVRSKNAVVSHQAKIRSRRESAPLDAKFLTQLKRMSEEDLYKTVIQAYRSGDIKKLRAGYQAMTSRYPDSVYADNAGYLNGLMEFQEGDWGHSLKSFDSVVKSYPQGNKRPAALYGKGVIYKKLNLPSLAKNVFQEVLKTYPGSPESGRAQMELRILSRNSSQGEQQVKAKE